MRSARTALLQPRSRAMRSSSLMRGVVASQGGSRTHQHSARTDRADHLHANSRSSRQQKTQRQAPHSEVSRSSRDHYRTPDTLQAILFMCSEAFTDALKPRNRRNDDAPLRAEVTARSHQEPRRPVVGTQHFTSSRMNDPPSALPFDAPLEPHDDCATLCVHSSAGSRSKRLVSAIRGARQVGPCSKRWRTSHPW